MNKSETIGQLALALSKAQGQMKFAAKDAANPFFKSKYADLASVIEAIKIPLSANGIAFVQATDFEDSAVIVETILLHESGEWISGKLRMQPTKNDPQGVGSAVTYAKRYGLQAIAGVPSDDDDGNAATHQAAPTAKPAPAKPMPAKVKEAAAALKTHAKGTISGDPSEGDLTGIAGNVVKPSGEVLSKVIHAFAQLGFTTSMLETEYGKPLADWVEDDIPEARELLKSLKISAAQAKAQAAEMAANPDGGEI
jgi:hypothetical protein